MLLMAFNAIEGKTAIRRRTYEFGNRLSSNRSPFSCCATTTKLKETPHNAIKEKSGEQPTRKQLEALLNLFARQQQIKPSDRVCQRGSDLPMRAGYSLLLFAFASLGIVSFGIEAGASKPQRHVRLWHEPKISHARAA